MPRLDGGNQTLIPLGAIRTHLYYLGRDTAILSPVDPGAALIGDDFGYSVASFLRVHDGLQERTRPRNKDDDRQRR
ncbi:hypothetical protein CFL01nite_11570 [Corynebacterium flavescens]|uniref:Uncharacterized protein n=1 Tax=Corynebacterium flavescens TaxID=28028 RepID=A0AB73B871_CORFL|nr:hypothetical protein CFL01nite_11570 [Corynebacterium flavescens]